VWGSLARHAVSSSVGIDRLAAKLGICLNSSMSRSSSGDFVSTEQGVRESRMASHTPGSSSYLFSTHWYGSVLVPSATCSRVHRGRMSSARATSGVLTLTTISRSKSSRALKSR
jgi:hypothetical protein